MHLASDDIQTCFLRFFIYNIIVVLLYNLKSIVNMFYAAHRIHIVNGKKSHDKKIIILIFVKMAI